MYCLTEIDVREFVDGASPAPNRLRLVSRCHDPTQKTSAEVFAALKAMEKSDQRQAIAGLKYMLRLAQLGKPFGQLLDKKAVHEAFAPFYCDVTKRNETIWRYRHGDVRILFYYAADKVVLLTHTLAKRTDKLATREKNVATQAVIEFLEASRSGSGLRWID